LRIAALPMSETLILRLCDFTLELRTLMALPAHNAVDDDLAQIEKDIR